MLLRHLFVIFLLAASPGTLFAELANGDLPAARWYAHVDLVAMRKGEAGRQLYAWLDREVFEEIREEVGFDVAKEADAFTALASPEGGFIFVVDGNFSQMSRDRLVALAALGGNFNSFEFEGSPYYFVGDDDADADKSAYVSVALKNKLLVAQSEAQLRQLIKSKGKIPGDYAGGGSLLVLSAEQNLVQAGANTATIGADLGWDSNVLRNTRQVALLVAEVAGKIAIEGRLTTNEATVANSLASIVRGLISLQVFNDDIDPALANLLQGTSVSVDGATLAIKLALDPATVLAAID